MTKQAKKHTPEQLLRRLHKANKGRENVQNYVSVSAACRQNKIRQVTYSLPPVVPN